MLPDREWKLKYTPDDGDLVQLFYVPALEDAERYDRLTGISTPAPSRSPPAGWRAWSETAAACGSWSAARSTRPRSRPSNAAKRSASRSSST